MYFFELGDVSLTSPLVNRSTLSEFFPSVSQMGRIFVQGVNSRADYDDIYKWKYDQDGTFAGAWRMMLGIYV